MCWKKISVLFFMYSFSIYSVIAEDLPCETFNGDLVVIPENQLAIMLLLSEYRCSGCDYFLNEYLNKFENGNSQITFYSFVNYGNSTLEKYIIKDAIEDKYNLSFSEFCFGFRNEYKKEFIALYSKRLFKYLVKFKSSPSLLLIKKDKRLLIKYNDLFNNVFISEDAKLKIETFLQSF